MLTDRMTMATSLECRVPLLDEELVDLMLHMPASMKVRGRNLKYGMKMAMKGVLPESIIERRKRGFGAPMGAWLKGKLLPMTEYFLSPEKVRERGLFNETAVESMMNSHVQGADDNTDKVLGLLNLEIWCRLYLDGQTPDELSNEIRECVVP